MRCIICNRDTPNPDYCGICNDTNEKIVYNDTSESLKDGEVPHQLDLEDYLKELEDL